MREPRYPLYALCSACFSGGYAWSATGVTDQAFQVIGFALALFWLVLAVAFTFKALRGY